MRYARLLRKERDLQRGVELPGEAIGRVALARAQAPGELRGVGTLHAIDLADRGERVGRTVAAPAWADRVRC